MIRTTLKRLAAPAGLSVTAAAAVFAIGAITAHTAGAASKPDVGSIYVHRFTFPSGSLRTAVHVFARAKPAAIRYQVWRQTPTGWKIAQTRRVQYQLTTPPPSGWGSNLDVRRWYGWQFGAAGRFRWQATLDTPNGSVSTGFRYFAKR